MKRVRALLVLVILIGAGSAAYVYMGRTAAASAT